jgi:hypothetical protein
LEAFRSNQFVLLPSLDTSFYRDIHIDGVAYVSVRSQSALPLFLGRDGTNVISGNLAAWDQQKGSMIEEEMGVVRSTAGMHTPAPRPSHRCYTRRSFGVSGSNTQVARLGVVVCAASVYTVRRAEGSRKQLYASSKARFR